MTHTCDRLSEKPSPSFDRQSTEKIKWVISSDLRENKEKMILVRKWNMKNVILIFYLAQADILEQINKNVIQPVSKVMHQVRKKKTGKMTWNRTWYEIYIFYFHRVKIYFIFFYRFVTFSLAGFPKMFLMHFFTFRPFLVHQLWITRQLLFEGTKSGMKSSYAVLHRQESDIKQPKVFWQKYPISPTNKIVSW